MINPVHAYYQIRFLSNLYYETEDETDDIYRDISEELMKYYVGMEFDGFMIKNVYEDGDCLITFQDDKRPIQWILLKNILEIK